MSLDVRDREERRQVLLAAETLFYARGIQDVGMDDIRTASGVSLKRLYQLFASKQELIAGYLDLSDRHRREGLAHYVDAVDDPREKLLAVFDWLASWFAEDDFRGCAFVNCFGELGATNPAVSAAARAHKQAFGDQLAELVAEAGGPAELAPHIALLAEGAITTSAIAGSPVPARQAKRAAAILLQAELGAPRGRRRRVSMSRR
jgi:AcrR family transcriptional regulator